MTAKADLAKARALAYALDGGLPPWAGRLCHLVKGCNSRAAARLLRYMRNAPAAEREGWPAEQHPPWTADPMGQWNVLDRVVSSASSLYNEGSTLSGWTRISTKLDERHKRRPIRL